MWMVELQQLLKKQNSIINIKVLLKSYYVLEMIQLLIDDFKVIEMLVVRPDATDTRSVIVAFLVGRN